MNDGELDSELGAIAKARDFAKSKAVNKRQQ